MKFIIITIWILILYFPLCAKNTGILYLNKVNGELIWMNTGNEKKHWKYKGEVKNGKPNGTGVLNSQYGEYVGELKNGMLHGQGTYTYKSGIIKVGEFKRGKPWNVKIFNKEGIVEEEWIDGKKIMREKIKGVKDKDLSDFKKDFRLRLIFGRTNDESTASNNAFLFFWGNYGMGLNQMSFETTSSKNILYEMKNYSLNLSYNFFIKDYILTSGVGYTFDGKGDITVESSSANYSTEDVSGYGVFGMIGMQWFSIETLIGFRYSSIEFKEFKGTNTKENLTLGIQHSIIEKNYLVSGSTFLLGIGYNF